MLCPKCGYVMSDLDVECPRCKRMGEQAAQQPEQPQPTHTDMQQVATFVAQKRAQGVPDAAIWSQLLEAGWPAAVVDGQMNTRAPAPQAAAQQTKKSITAGQWIF